MTATPSPQSVVVPDPLAEMRAAAGYLRNAKIDLETGAPKSTAIRTIQGGLKRLEASIDAFASGGKAIAAAPAPSSLAGGEVDPQIIARLQAEADAPGIADSCIVFGPDLRAVLKRLAALSPEAPAREGVDIGEEFDNAAHCVTLAECPPGLFLWNGTLGFKSEYGAMEPDDATNGKHWKVGNRADAYCADSGEYFWGGTSTYDDRAKVLVYPIDAGKVAMVASHGPAALTPRHEAPAEGAGEPRDPEETHPAAPSADKLRTALSEIRDGMVASRDCISVDDWIELADEALSIPDALKGGAKP